MMPVSAGTFPFPFRSGWDHEFESAFLQRRVRRTIGPLWEGAGVRSIPLRLAGMGKLARSLPHPNRAAPGATSSNDERLTAEPVLVKTLSSEATRD
jgi:hypothetical protein